MLPVSSPKIVNPVKLVTNDRMKPFGVGFRSDPDNRGKESDEVQDYSLK